MANITANGIQIEYENFGNRSNSALILINGLGSQMISWDIPLCEKLANAGHYIIKFDNRDVGLSTKTEEAGVPDIMEALGKLMEGKSIDTPYTLDDMADDTVGLMDALNIEKAHICGTSMGAAICQTVGIKHPSRVLSLTTIFGTTGNPELPQAKPEVLQAIMTPPVEGRDAFVEQKVNGLKIIKGSKFPFDEEWHQNLAMSEYDRCFYPEGGAQQFLGMLAHGNRKPALTKVTAPTLVIHGKEDPLIPVEGGIDIADAIPNAELMLIDGFGHELPRLGGAWEQITDKIIEFTANVDSQ